jgi:hypothetical protein
MTVGSWLENTMERDHAEDMVVDGRVILKCFKEIGRNRLDYILLAVDRDRWQVAGACECVTGHSICIKCGEFLD